MELKYLVPTRILMGKDCVASSATDIAKFGRNALVVTGANSARASGALGDVLAALARNGQNCTVFDRVRSNPTVASVYEGADFAREIGADFIIAIGGGSPMDAAKAIALLARQSIPESALFSGSYGDEALPLVHVPTTAGTGSEVTQYAILTNDRAETKMSISSPSLFPKLAILDAKYLEALPREVTINTAIDSFSHSVEGILSIRATPLTDLLAAESIRLIASVFRGISAGGLERLGREKLLYASTLGGMVIANTGTTSVHSMGYQLTYHRQIDHGRANGLLIDSFLEFAVSRIPARIKIALGAAGLESVGELRSILDGLLGDRETVTAQEIAKFAGAAALAKNVANCAAAPTAADMAAMYASSLTVAP